MKTRKKAPSAKRRLPIRPIPIKAQKSPDDEVQKSLSQLARHSRLKISPNSALSPTHSRSSSDHVTPERRNVFVKTAFTTPPRYLRTEELLGSKFRVSPESGARVPKTPTKRRKSMPVTNEHVISIIASQPCSAENSVEPLPVAVNEVYGLKLSSSKARRCLFPSDQATFKQNNEVFAKHVDSHNKRYVDRKSKKWAYDFQKDEPLKPLDLDTDKTDTRSSSPIWTEALDAPKFYRTRGYVSRNSNKRSPLTAQPTSYVKSDIPPGKPQIDAVVESPMAKERTTPVKRSARSSCSSEPSSTKKKRYPKTTPQKQTKITDTFSPRKACKSTSPGKKLGTSTRSASKGKKKLKL